MAKTITPKMVLLSWSKMVPVSQAQDPLGLSLRVSARLSSELLHCITSITPRARYFSFLPWCVADFEKREKARQAEADLIEGVRLREKALTLGCVLHHSGVACKDGRLVGSDEAVDWLAAHPGKTPEFSKLSFVKNPALNAYKNSLVQLGFFKETPEGIPVVDESETEDGNGVEIGNLELSALGARVAERYEKAIGHLPVAGKLTREPDGCKPAELKRWGECGGLCELAQPDAPDRAMLRDVFFNYVGSPGESHKFRHDSLVLFLELINKIAPRKIQFDHFVLRDAVYFNTVLIDEEKKTTMEIRLPLALADIGNRWRMFHFHFFLSVALESLFCGVVGYVQRAGMMGTSLEEILDSLKSKSVMKFFSRCLGKKLDGSFIDSSPRELFQSAGFKVAHEFKPEEFDSFFDFSNPISESSLDSELRLVDLPYASPEGIACALLLLTMTVCRYAKWDGTAYGNWLARHTNDPYRDVTAPVVLRELRESLGDFTNAKWREIARLVMGRFVVRQHEVLAYEKVWDGTRALFHSEQGRIRWRGMSYDNIVVENSRFYSAVQILEDLALVAHEDGNKVLAWLTPDGASLLKSELTKMEAK